uniref:Uncharacterized protein n=1 Tax=Anguilla anguilla TaxID=7936 RepID=A0A0E9U068_ANGAN
MPVCMPWQYRFERLIAII